MTPLNVKRGHILKEISHTRLIDLPAQTDRPMGVERDKWCRFHRTYGHDTKDCWTLQHEIKRLIQDGYLEKYVRHQGQTTRTIKSPDRREVSRNRSPQRNRQPDKSKPEDQPEKNPRGTMNPIARGFTGGGTTSFACKHYALSVMSVHSGKTPSYLDHPVLVFTPKDFEGVLPHEDDPVVVSVVTGGWCVKHVLIDLGSSANVLFWDAYKKLDLPEEKLQPFKKLWWVSRASRLKFEVCGFTDYVWSG